MIRVHSVLCKTLQGWFTSNTKAYWPVLLTNIKQYILRSSMMVDMEFVMPFKAPSIPISMPWYRADVGPERGGEEGRPFGLWVFRAMLRSSCPC